MSDIPPFLSPEQQTALVTAEQRRQQLSATSGPSAAGDTASGDAVAGILEIGAHITEAVGDAAATISVEGVVSGMGELGASAIGVVGDVVGGVVEGLGSLLDGL